MKHRDTEQPELLPGQGESVEAGELCELCNLETEVLVEWVSLGVVEPAGARVAEWRFSARQVRRAHTARRLQRDLELTPDGLPLVLDLLEEVRSLRRQVSVLRRSLE